MSTLDQIKALAAQAAESAEDMNVAVKGGGGELLPAGAYLARLVEYIEFGKQPQEFNGQPKDPAMEFRLGFEIQTTNGPVLFRTFDFSYSRNPKARAFLLFSKLNYKGLAKQFYQLIDSTYLINIVVKKSKSSQKEYNELDVATVAPPIEPLSKQPYPVPEYAGKYLMFLWEHPTIEAWDALHIEGARDDGTSKNFLQDKCLSAVDFPGSALEGLLLGSGKAFTRPAAAPASTAAALPAAPVVLPDLPAPAAPVAPAAVPAMPAAPLPSALPNLPAMPVAPAA